MRIALLTHFYAPEPCAAANRAYALAMALRAAGHRVTVITTFPSFPQRTLAPEDRLRFFSRSRGEVDLIRLLSIVYGGRGSRLVQWSSSALALTAYMLFTRKRFDAVIVSVPPITLALPALAAKIRHRAKLIVDVRDVYPDVAIAMGLWERDGWLARTARSVTSALYRRAALIAAVTPRGMQQIAARDVNTARLACFPNGCDDIAPSDSAPAHDGENFTAVYVGNLGLATDVDVLVDAAFALKDDDGIRIRIVGDGVEGQRMRRRVEELALKNIHFMGALSRDRALALLEQSDAAIVPLRRGIADSIPTKIFDALCVACPVIVAADGEAAALTRESGAGICVPPGDPGALADGLRTLRAFDADRRRRMGEEGRDYVTKFHRRTAIMERYVERIASA